MPANKPVVIDTSVNAADPDYLHASNLVFAMEARNLSLGRGDADVDDTTPNSLADSLGNGASEITAPGSIHQVGAQFTSYVDPSGDLFSAEASGMVLDAFTLEIIFRIDDLANPVNNGFFLFAGNFSGGTVHGFSIIFDGSGNIVVSVNEYDGGGSVSVAPAAVGDDNHLIISIGGSGSTFTVSHNGTVAGTANVGSVVPDAGYQLFALNDGTYGDATSWAWTIWSFRIYDTNLSGAQATANFAEPYAVVGATLAGGGTDVAAEIPGGDGSAQSDGAGPLVASTTPNVVAGIPGGEAATRSDGAGPLVASATPSVAAEIPGGEATVRSDGAGPLVAAATPTIAAEIPGGDAATRMDGAGPLVATPVGVSTTPAGIPGGEAATRVDGAGPLVASATPSVAAEIPGTSGDTVSDGAGPLVAALVITPAPGEDFIPGGSGDTGSDGAGPLVAAEVITTVAEIPGGEGRVSSDGGLATDSIRRVVSGGTPRRKIRHQKVITVSDKPFIDHEDELLLALLAAVL